MITQRSGGWPLTMFLAHDDQRPFFGGTYFPKEARFGLPAFKDLLLRVAARVLSRASARYAAQGEALVKALDLMNSSPAHGEVVISDAPLRACRTQLARLFDTKNGGFGGAPKFPQPPVLTRLLRDWRATTAAPEPDLRALYMATLTLRRMADGGINDQLGGGFYRYAVDELWMIPHFEKDAVRQRRPPRPLRAGGHCQRRCRLRAHRRPGADYVLRELQSAQGGFYSSFDADSEGHEGTFYVWTREQVQAALSAQEFALFAPRYGLERPATASRALAPVCRPRNARRRGRRSAGNCGRGRRTHRCGARKAARGARAARAAGA